MGVADPQGYLLTICENGYGKRTPFGANQAGEEPPEPEEAAEEIPEEPIEESGDPGDILRDRSGMRYRKQRRGGKGLRDIRTSDRNGLVVGIASVRDDHDIMLITTQGMVNRTRVNEIRVVGRNTQGVRIMNLREGDKIASIAKVAHEDEPESPEDAPVPTEPPATPPV
jgi:DNA gyrase subunit A